MKYGLKMVEGILTMVSDNPQLRVASITCGRSSSTKLRGFLRSNSKKNEAILHILILEYDPHNLYQVNPMFFSFPLSGWYRHGELNPISWESHETKPEKKQQPQHIQYHLMF
jgi:hypothetical protein